MNTPYEAIVDVASIGKGVNPIDQGKLLMAANGEKMQPAARPGQENVLAVFIDYQSDFMDNGNLGVSGACKDIENVTRWFYRNMDKIKRTAVSIDTHIPQQIFHPCWWIDENGDNPAPFTTITLADLDSGKWRAVLYPIKSRDYVMSLEAKGKKKLVVWNYHCLQGTPGAALESQFANMVYFHSVAKKSTPMRIVKGQDPLSEMYGIIRPEYDTKGYINLSLLNQFEEYDKIVIAGEAYDYCVYESLCQMLEYYQNRPDILSKFYVLSDCMSSIGNRADVDKMYNDLQKKYKFNIVDSTSFDL